MHTAPKLGLLLAAFAACSVSNVDPGGRPCSATVRCGPGYRCVLGACVRQGATLDARVPDLDAPPPDVPPGTDAPAGPDAPASPFGQGSWELGPPQRVAELSSPAWDGELALSADGLLAYVSSERSGGVGLKDVWVATRSSRFGSFGPLSNLAALNTTSNETLTPNLDGLTAFLASDRPGSAGAWDIWIGTRASAADPWQSSAFQPIVALGTAESQNDPCPSADGLELFFTTRNLPGGSGGQDLARATRADPTAAFGAPQALAQVNAPGNDADPTLSPDGRVLVFASSSARSGASGGVDLWYATRKDGASPFSTPQPLAVNTGDNEGEPLITPDGLELYFASDRPGGQGDLDIYRVRIIKGP